MRARQRPARRVLLVLLALVGSACTHSGPPTGGESIPSSWPVQPEQVVLRGDNVRMELLGEAGRIVLGASWSARGLDEDGPRMRTAWLAPLPPERSAGGHERRREVRVLGPASWHLFVSQVGERFVSPVPGEATRLVLEGAGALLVRGQDGRVHSLPVGQSQGEVRVTREVTQAIFLAEALRLLEGGATSKRGKRGRPLLFQVVGTDHRGGFLLFDPGQQLCVVLPHAADFQVERQGSSLGRTAEVVSALTLESHGLALLKNPVSSVGRLVNSVAQILAGVAGSGIATGDRPPPPLANGEGMDLERWERELDTLTGTRRTRGAIRLLVDGERYFQLLEERIREAAESVDVRVNIFDTDDVAVKIADLLRARSEQVRVRVLVDRLSTLGAAGSMPSTPMPAGFRMPASITRYLHGGSRVKVRSFLNPWGTSDHTKVFLFDRRYAHLGGMNIGREYRYEWHDLMVELEGPVVGELGEEFDRAWGHAGAAGDLGFLAAALFKGEWFEGDRERPDYVVVRLLYTRTGDPQIYLAETEAMARAERDIWLENPYLYDNSVVDELVRARRRGVDVRVVLPADSDLGLGNLSNMVTANLLIANGVRVFVYPGMTHVKALIVDGWACLGSANFNALSLRRNLEANIATSDPGFVGKLRRELFESDFTVSNELERPVEPGSGARLAAWVMDQL